MNAGTSVRSAIASRQANTACRTACCRRESRRAPLTFRQASASRPRRAGLQRGHRRALLAHPLQPPQLLQRGHQPVVERDEVRDVGQA